MIEVSLSEHTVAAARELDELHERGELFSEDGYLRSDPTVEAASQKFLDAVEKDLLREIDGQSDGPASLYLLNPEKPSDLARYHRGGHRIACPIKIPLGGGWCAYGRYERGACWYDGIGRC